jgi:hypothetical protein
MTTMRKRPLLLLGCLCLVPVGVMLLCLMPSGSRYLAVSYVRVNDPSTNSLYSHSFEVQAAHPLAGTLGLDACVAEAARTLPDVFRFELLPVIFAQSGATNRNAAGVRIVAFGSSPEQASRAATDAAGRLSSRVRELYGLSAFSVPTTEEPHRYSLARDTLRPKAVRFFNRLRAMII